MRNIVTQRALCDHTILREPAWTDKSEREQEAYTATQDVDRACEGRGRAIGAHGGHVCFTRARESKRAVCGGLSKGLSWGSLRLVVTLSPCCEICEAGIHSSGREGARSLVQAAGWLSRQGGRRTLEAEERERKG